MRDIGTILEIIVPIKKYYKKGSAKTKEYQDTYFKKIREDPVRYKEAKERWRKAEKKWRTNNKEKVRERKRRRKQRLRFEILKRDNFTCKYCGRHAPDVILHIDHIFPKSKGGSTEKENLVTSCSDCNWGKSDVLLN